MILALDLATQTGWAAGAPNTLPRYGSFRIEAGGKQSAATFARTIDRLIREHHVELVFFEQPVMGSGDKKFANFKSKRLLFGLTHTTEAVAQMAGCRVFEVPIATWRKHFLGNARYEREDAKRAAMTRARQLGYRPETEDEAEALGIWDYAASLKSRSHGWDTSPLMTATRGQT